MVDVNPFPDASDRSASGGSGHRAACVAGERNDD